VQVLILIFCFFLEKTNITFTCFFFFLFSNNAGELHAFLLKERGKKDQLQCHKARLMLIMVKHFFFETNQGRELLYIKRRPHWVAHSTAEATKTTKAGWNCQTIFTI